MPPPEDGLTAKVEGAAELVAPVDGAGGPGIEAEVGGRGPESSGSEAILVGGSAGGTLCDLVGAGRLAVPERGGAEGPAIACGAGDTLCNPGEMAGRAAPGPAGSEASNWWVPGALDNNDPSTGLKTADCGTGLRSGAVARRSAFAVTFGFWGWDFAR